MELVFVHESGHLGFDGASDTSEESNEDEEGCGRFEFSSSGAGTYSTMRGCAFPVEGSRPRSEEVSFCLGIEVSLLTAGFCFCFVFSFWTCHTPLK